MLKVDRSCVGRVRHGVGGVATVFRPYGVWGDQGVAWRRACRVWIAKVTTLHVYHVRIPNL
eukprot:5139345-Pyramimonas_sp.AAC.1